LRLTFYCLFTFHLFFLTQKKVCVVFLTKINENKIDVMQRYRETKGNRRNFFTTFLLYFISHRPSTLSIHVKFLSIEIKRGNKKGWMSWGSFVSDVHQKLKFWYHPSPCNKTIITKNPIDCHKAPPLNIRRHLWTTPDVLCI